MISWSDEVASFREVVMNRAGLGFVLCAAGVVWFTIALTHEIVQAEPVPGVPMYIALFIAAVPFAYFTERETLRWLVTRIPILGITTMLGAGFAGALFGYRSGGEAYVQESIFGLVGLIGTGLLLATVPAAVAFITVMAVNGAGGRSSESDDFSEE